MSFAAESVASENSKNDVGRNKWKMMKSMNNTDKAQLYYEIEENDDADICYVITV